jgi:hypothetical protein
LQEETLLQLQDYQHPAAPTLLQLLLQLLLVPEGHQPQESKLQQNHRLLHHLLLILPN